MAPRVGHVFKPLYQRLEEKYIPEPNSGCWLWIGATNNCGYGTMTMGHDKRAYAHRVSYEMHKGPIPDGMHLDHLCRVPLCVNPDHLEPVTNRENTIRGNAGKQHRDRPHCLRGHAFETHGYIDSQGHRQCRLCLHERQRTYRTRKKHVQ